MSDKQTTTEVKADISGAVSLEQELKGKNKAQLIQYADQQLGLAIDGTLDEKVIRENLIRYMDTQLNAAREKSEKSAKLVATDDDPLMEVIFRNLQSMNEDITFAFAGDRGTFGPKNKKGFKKMPTYHLFPGMRIELPYSVIEHLRSKVFTRHIPVYDDATGQIGGVRAIITPRFILDMQFTKEQAIALQKLK